MVKLHFLQTFFLMKPEITLPESSQYLLACFLTTLCNRLFLLSHSHLICSKMWVVLFDVLIFFSLSYFIDRDFFSAC